MNTETLDNRDYDDPEDIVRDAIMIASDAIETYNDRLAALAERVYGFAPDFDLVPNPIPASVAVSMAAALDSLGYEVERLSGLVEFLDRAGND